MKEELERDRKWEHSNEKVELRESEDGFEGEVKGKKGEVKRGEEKKKG